MDACYPPNYLHESWMDYLYWDSVLDALIAKLLRASS